MASPHPIDRLALLSRQFGSDAAKEKLRLLGDIAAIQRHSTRRILLLHDTLYFMRAYPDNPAVLRAVMSQLVALRRIVTKHTGGDVEHAAFINTGLPASSNAYTYSYAVLERLSRLYPRSLAIDWSQVDFEPPYVDPLNLAVLPAESRGLEDEFLTLRGWLADNAAHPAQTDLDVVLRLFAEAPLEPKQRAHVFETCEYPVLYHLNELGSARCETTQMPDTVFYQKRPLSSTRFLLKPRITRPLRDYRTLGRRAGQDILDLSLRALCARNLEIHPLVYANPDDVTLVDAGRGLQVVLAGMLPGHRPVVESDFFFLILKNGVPAAYGPASIFMGCCEMGINLFPEFRGGEIRYIYAQFMRALYHLAGVRYFFVISYGMGENNPDALRSGAFWFYRKLGFRAANPAVEALAREEEAVMRRTPGYRSPMSTLRKLSYTDAYFDLSNGSCRPLSFEDLALAVSRYITDEFGGSRSRARNGCVRQLVAALGIGDHTSWTRDERCALERLAPILVQLPDLDEWPKREKRALVSAIRAKGARREFTYLRRAARVPRLVSSLHSLTNRD